MTVNHIPCPDCGNLIKPRGLGAHRGRLSCRLRRNAREAEARGLVLTSSTQALKKHPLSVWICDHILSKGFVGRRTKTGDSLYAPRWLVAISNLVDVAERDRLLALSVDLATREDAEAFGRMLVAVHGHGKFIHMPHIEFTP